MSLYFSCQDVDFKLSSPKETKTWIASTVKQEKAKLSRVDCIFCSDQFLHQINTKHLGHDTYTDIITFDYSTSTTEKILAGDIFISIERVRENAEKFNTTFTKEIHRVLVHGILHLLGFDDKNPSDQALMKQKEELYLSLIP